VIRLKEPTGLVLAALAKPSSSVPFMVPKRGRDRPQYTNRRLHRLRAIIFKRDEWKPGDKTVYVKFEKYVPRSEPASGLADRLTIRRCGKRCFTHSTKRTS